MCADLTTTRVPALLRVSHGLGHIYRDRFLPNNISHGCVGVVPSTAGDSLSELFDQISLFPMAGSL